MPRPLRCPKCRSSKISQYDKHRVDYSTCYDCSYEFNRRDESRDLFHTLWTKAAKRKGYDKRIWERLALLSNW